MRTARTEALALAAERGLPVFPVYGIEPETGRCLCGQLPCPRGSTPGKHPMVRFTEVATTDPDQIRQWWATWPSANVGVRCDGITVVDVDFRHGGAESHTWLDGRPDTPLVPTFTVQTGNGFHQYYRGESRSGKLLEGIDLKSGPGAYVVGPGSLHEGGTRYRVQLDHAIAEPAVPLGGGSGRGRRASATGGGTTRDAVPPEVVREGGRNDFLKTRAAQLRNYLDRPAVLETALQALNRAVCSPPYPPERVTEIAQWAARLEGGARWTPGGRTGSDRSISLLTQIKGLGAVLDQTPPGWFVEGLVPEAELSVLYGHGGTKKSFVALDWLLCAATGRAWLGHRVTPGAGLYVATEGSRGLGQRVRAWAAREELPVDDLRPRGAVRFGVLPRAVNLLDEGAAGELAAAANDLEVAYVVIDTLRRAMPGGDENLQRDVGALIGGAELVAKRARCQVLLVHHAAGADKRRMRGSTVIHDDVDAVVGLARGGDPLHSTLFPIKLKDAEEFPPLDLVFQVYPVGDKDPETGQVPTSLAVSELAREAVDEGAEEATAWLRLLELLRGTGAGEVLTKAVAQTHLGVAARTATATLQRGCERRLLVLVRAGKDSHYVRTERGV